MATQPQSGLTYQDLLGFPEPATDGLRREIIDGELFVTPAPTIRHQRAVVTITVELALHVRVHGGEVLAAPTDVFFADDSVVEPDVLYLGPDNLHKVETAFIRSAPDIVVEVFSPSTRALELVRKRELYERHGVPEYWYVDLDVERIEVYRLHDGAYGQPTLLTRTDTLTSPLLVGFELATTDALGVPPA